MRDIPSPPVASDLFWQYMRHRVDEHAKPHVTLLMSEIKAFTGAPPNIDRRWWWQLILDGDEIACLQLKKHGLVCYPHFEGEHVTTLTFART